MYKQTTELIESYGTPYQTGKHAPNVRVMVFKKAGDGKYQMNLPYQLDGIISVRISRSTKTGANQATVVLSNTKGYYSPDYSKDTFFTNIPRDLPHGTYRDVILPYNLVHIEAGYGEHLMRIFTGYITRPQISDKEQTITFDVYDEYVKLLRPVDTINYRRLAYRDVRASFVITDLLRKAGVEDFLIDTESIDEKDFTINQLLVDLGTSYEAALKEILTIMNHTIKVNRFGVLHVKQLFTPGRLARPVVDLSDVLNITDGNYYVDDNLVRSKIIVQGGAKWKAYKDVVLSKYLNDVDVCMGIEVPWANTDEELFTVAKFYFYQMRRKMRSMSVVAISNPALDIEDIANLESFISGQNNKYMISSIETSISDSGFLDTIELEYITDVGDTVVEADGDYEPFEIEVDEDGETTEKPLEQGEAETPQDKVIKSAKKYIDTFYQHGGDKSTRPSDYGFDASNFIFACLNQNDSKNFYKTLPELLGEATVIELSDIKLADVVFWLNENGVPVSAGFYMGGETVIGMFGGDETVTTEGAARKRNAKCKKRRLEGNFVIGRVI